MSAMRQDWLLRQLEALGHAMAALLARRREVPADHDLAAISDLSTRLLGLDLDTLLRFGPDEAAALLGAPDRRVLAAALLAERGARGGGPAEVTLATALLAGALAEAPELHAAVPPDLAARLGLASE